MTDTAAIRYDREIPDILQALGRVQGAIDQGGLEPRLRHLVVLRASQINGCAHCVKMHIREARRDGETGERLDRLVVWRHVDDYSAREKAALAWTEALTTLDPRTEFGALRAALREHFGDAEIGTLTALVGMINLWNRIQVSRH